jgi:phage-related protein
MLTSIVLIKFYKKQNKRSPVEEFLDSLNAKQAKKVTWVLQLIEELDKIHRQYFKKLVNTDDIWEVRVRIGNDAIRLLGFIEKGTFIILTNGFMKKSQKTPKVEIQLAEKRKKDFIKRKRK